LKRAYVLAGALILSVVMLASIGAAAAQEIHYADLEIKARGIIWHFNTQEAIEPFSGKDVVKSSVVATTWDEDGVETTLDPLLIITTKNCVILIFLPRDLPTEETAGTMVTGTLKNGDEFLATGPGFGFGRRP
jgi:hypothetical protein